MPLTTANKWLTVCLHYNEPWEELLVKAVKPYVDVVLQTGVAEQFYFQRSWERGPHIRLSFQGNPVILEKVLKPNLDEHFLQYFESRPSVLMEPQYPVDYPDSKKWFPNNSIRWADKNPNRCNYFLRPLYEKQYSLSSVLVLKILSEKSSWWTQNEMINSAVKLHLVFARAAGMSLEETADFFNLLFENWKQNLYKKSTTEKHLELILNSYHRIFEAQRKDLLPYQSALWEPGKSYLATGDTAFANWFTGNAKIAAELDLLVGQGVAITHSGSDFRQPELEGLWSCFADFILQTDNRLGIHNQQEGYLFYSLNRGLRYLISSPQTAALRVAAG